MPPEASEISQLPMPCKLKTTNFLSDNLQFSAFSLLTNEMMNDSLTELLISTKRIDISELQSYLGFLSSATIKSFWIWRASSETIEF